MWPPMCANANLAGVDLPAAQVSVIDENNGIHYLNASKVPRLPA